MSLEHCLYFYPVSVLSVSLGGYMDLTEFFLMQLYMEFEKLPKSHIKHIPNSADVNITVPDSI